MTILNTIVDSKLDELEKAKVEKPFGEIVREKGFQFYEDPNEEYLVLSATAIHNIKNNKPIYGLMLNKNPI